MASTEEKRCYIVHPASQLWPNAHALASGRERAESAPQRPADESNEIPGATYQSAHTFRWVVAGGRLSVTWCPCVYVPLCALLFPCVFVFVHTCVCAHVDMGLCEKYVCMYPRVCMCPCVLLYSLVYLCLYIRVYVPTWIYAYVRNMYLSMHVRTHVCKFDTHLRIFPQEE